MDYLEQNLGNSTFNVLVSRTHKFMYHDVRKAQRTKGFNPDVTFEEMTFTNFLARLRRKDDKQEEDDEYVCVIYFV